MYTARGFNIKAYHGDNGFDINALREHTRPVNLNIWARGIHMKIINDPFKPPRNERAAPHTL